MFGRALRGRHILRRFHASRDRYASPALSRHNPARLFSYACRDTELPIILAYEMNGKELTPEHGYPLRVAAPGRIGARWVKWLERIVIRPVEVSLV